MSEKTAEEKLRQELEGNTSGTKDSVQPKSQSKPKPSRARPKSGSSRSVKSESIGERLDSFMDDFERRIEQSINAVKSPSESHVKPRREKISAERKPETSRRVHTAVKANPEPLEELIPSKPQSSHKAEAIHEDLPVSQPESTQKISQHESSHEVDAIQEDSHVSQPESVPEIAQHESSPKIDAIREDLPVSQPESAQEISHHESSPEIDTLQEDSHVSQPESTPEISQHESSPKIDAIREDLPVSQPESAQGISHHESSPDIDTLQEDLPVSQPEATQEISQHESSPDIDAIQEDLPVSQPESVPEIAQHESSPKIDAIREDLPVSQPESAQGISHHESSPEVDTLQEDLPVSQPEATQEIAQHESSHEVDATREDLTDLQPGSVPKISQHESSHDIDTLQEDLPVSQPEATQEIAQHESSHEVDTLQEDLPVSQPESVPEEIIPDVMPIDEELPDIPVIEAAFDEVPEKTQTPYGDLPDIPVISADDEDDDAEEIFSDGLEDITPPADDEPRKEPQIEFQEAELTEAPEIEDDFADIDADTDDFIDEPLDEEPETPDAEDDAPPYDIESDEAGIFADDSDDDIADDTHEDFTPSADIVLNVDDEIPQISQQEQITNDPEAESVPVTVTMPESTKTAEDKLMADIAEAMTGNPLSLESNEAPAYNIPENFFTEGANNGDSPQSAEDKLKANIVQALSESPINAAHEQAHQSLEEDINPFDELSITEPEIETHDEDFLPQESFDADESLTEESHDNEESSAEESINDEDFLPKESLDDEELLPQKSIDDEELSPEKTNDDEDFTPQETNIINDDNDDELMPDSDSLTENEDDTESLNDPFTIPDFLDDETESETSANLESSEDETKFFTEAFKGDDNTDEASEPETDLDLLPKIEPETEPAQDIFTEPELQPEPEILRKPEINTEEESESPVNDNDMPFPVEEPKQEPLTEQEALIAMLNQEFEPESNNFTAQKEAQPENNMPEQSLLNDDAPENLNAEENNDDWDISSLGEELGQAATLADESEDFSASPETVTEMITQPEAGLIHNPEDDHKEKTMNIREKLASRKNGNSESTAAGKSSKSGLLLTVLTALLAVIGGLIVWQLMQVSDKITSLAMNAPGYESSARAETPSYDYAIDFILDPNLSDRMSQRGRAGWQVVGSRRTQDSTTGQYGYEFIFMRRTPGR